MKCKLIAALLPAALGLLVLAGCGGAKKPADVNRFLVTEGVALTRSMDELSEDPDYIQLMAGYGGIGEIVGQMAAQSYEKPESVFLVQMPAKLLPEIMGTLGEEPISDALMDKLQYKINGVIFANMINGTFGAETLAATSIMTWSKSYIQPEGWEDNVMLLIEYEGDFSSIVSFSKSGDGVITGAASFVKNGDEGLFPLLKELVGETELDSRELAGAELEALLTAAGK